jgi:diguanylate cyclase (GGDEF)-like protein/PAS domain S-box-containing protein
MNKRRVFYSLLILLVLVVAVAGWFATDYLGNKARQEIIGEGQAAVLVLSTYVSSTFTNIEGTVQSLAGSPWIAPALVSKSERDVEQANSALDRYNSALNASVSYLMDIDGMTVASSNRKDPDSFLGKSYRFRPYFQDAAKGRAGRYLALGVTSGKRGFYASYPVQNRAGKVIGVVTMKKDLDDMGAFFRKYPFCFLISPDGIIFLSSKLAMVLKSFWPLDKKEQEKLIASQQFGDKLFETVFFEKEVVDGAEVTLEGKDYFVSRKVIDSDGWSIVLLTPTDDIRIYKLTGILATISVGFLIIVFSGIIYVIDRSKEAIRQSEESRSLLLHAAGEGILGVDTAGRVTFINPAALRMLGFAAEEMLGQSVHGLIHHSHADGSRYPMEECPMYASYTRAAENHVIGEVLWRKDGSSFPVEYSSTPIAKDGKVTGAVVTFQDITERKRIEEALRDSEKRYRELSIVDDLTQLYNSRHFYFQLKIELDRSNRYEQPLTLLLLDLDNFKSFNDAYGHVEGDQVLRRLGQVIKKCMRETDFAYRYGGEEFTILLPMTTTPEGAVTAERIRTEFRKEIFSPAPGKEVHMTLSIGLAQYKPQEEIKPFVHRVDQLMYKAKKNGKDRICSEA